jgi:hypothetical protein
MIHVRHAAAAIASGLCETVLIRHGESGRSGVGRTRNVVHPPALPVLLPSLPAGAGLSRESLRTAFRRFAGEAWL